MKTAFSFAGAVRGFPASPTARICGHVDSHANASRRPLSEQMRERVQMTVEPPAPLDVCAVFGLHPYRKDETKRKASVPLRALPVSASVEMETREFFIPYNPPRYHTKKDGTTREMKIKVQLITATVFLKSGSAAPVKIYTASNRGQTILDCRTQKRLPLCEVRHALARLDAQAIGDELAELLPPPREKVKGPGKIPAAVEGAAEGRIPEWQAKFHRHSPEDAEPVAPDEELTDEAFIEKCTADAALAMDIIVRSGTAEFYN